MIDRLTVLRALGPGLLCAAFALGSSACISVDLGDVPFLCSPAEQCPDGYYCRDNKQIKVCVRNGSCPLGFPGCPPLSCGNTKCDDGETCANCPGDCGGCGDGSVSDVGLRDVGLSDGPNDRGITLIDGKVRPDSTIRRDGAPPPDGGNGPCTTEGAGKCANKNTLNICKSGVWQPQDCNTLCAQGGYDYSVECGLSSSSGREVCMCADFGGLGATCDDRFRCDPSLFCGRFIAAKPGFCSKVCQGHQDCTGTPPGTKALCALSINSQTACGFVCGSVSPTSTCPSGLNCDTANGVCEP